jgi:hypothetical protein
VVLPASGPLKWEPRAGARAGDKRNVASAASRVRELGRASPVVVPMPGAAAAVGSAGTRMGASGDADVATLPVPLAVARLVAGKLPVLPKRGLGGRWRASSGRGAERGWHGPSPCW